MRTGKIVRYSPPNKALLFFFIIYSHWIPRHFRKINRAYTDRRGSSYFCLSFKYNRCDSGFVYIHTSPTGLKYFVSQSRQFSLRILASSRCFCSNWLLALVARSMSFSRSPAVTSSQMRRDSCSDCSLIGRTIFLYTGI